MIPSSTHVRHSSIARSKSFSLYAFVPASRPLHLSAALAAEVRMNAAAIVKIICLKFFMFLPTLLEFFEAFAEFLDKKLELSGSNLSFVIGGSYGLGDALKNRCNDFITLSKMTFLHQMTRLILLEQIYRAFKINRHEVYHK